MTMSTDLHSIVELPAMSIPQAKSLADGLSSSNLTVEFLNCHSYHHPMMERQDKEGTVKTTRKLIVFPHGNTYEEAQQQLNEFLARLEELQGVCKQRVYGLREAVR
ncbi:hypothetical protein HYV83_01080 [Candidatus Woesearchaeota archaeon]|nr:hypothetical protein [Candidatus Woesearchaeota archaeon]